MPGTQAQKVRWVALDEQLPPASTLGLLLALALLAALGLLLALVLAAGVVLLLDVLEPPLLQAASSVIAATPATPATSLAVPSLVVLLSQDIAGAPSLPWCRLR
jgi:hypothetical protein